MDDVVITGTGAVTPLGNDVRTFWENLIAGKSGIGRVTRFDVDDLPTQVAGEIKGFDPLKWMSRQTARRATLATQFAVAASMEALQSAHVEITDENRQNIGIYVGSGLCGLSDFENTILREGAKGWRRMHPLSPILESNHATAFVLSCDLEITGPALTISSVCNSGNNALGVAFDQLLLHRVDMALVVGVDSVSPVAFKGFCRLGATSRSKCDPATASRPFDYDRDGFVAAEGAGALVLERQGDARKRGIKPNARLAGYGFTGDAYNIAKIEPSGAQISRAMSLALKSSRTEPGDVSYICAHAPSMPDTDRTETQAIKRTFGPLARHLPVSSIKGAVGSPIGGTNAMQWVSAVQSLRYSVIPPTVNYETPDPECDLDCVPGDAREATLHCVIINSHAFGGGNSSVVMKTL
ncbi:MAG: beta-ketoacyl-[acyl-carrier-protein] synthase family protein [Deltaproteobacteria bacterium]|nr:beta-ketoacyl-[acyl-carrier-protein] synthase family protein [Deltaproteobacteria bacterium]